MLICGLAGALWYPLFLFFVGSASFFVGQHGIEDKTV